MATSLVYLNGFDIVTCHATVTTVEKTEDGRIDIQLDQTCFYPRGGGQDWDTGTIIKPNDSIHFEVQEVHLDENGIAHHIGATQTDKLRIGDVVDCLVDIKRRNVNTRLHSAGHMIDLVVDRLKLPWVPGRGAHYPHMSFVEYNGEVNPEEIEAIKQQIEQIANESITRGSQNEVRFMSLSQMHTVCRHVPTNIPTHKPGRVVIYDGTFGVPCGGTHVGTVRDIGRLTITKIKTKKGTIKVSYALEDVHSPHPIKNTQPFRSNAQT